MQFYAELVEDMAESIDVDLYRVGEQINWLQKDILLAIMFHKRMKFLKLSIKSLLRYNITV